MASDCKLHLPNFPVRVIIIIREHVACDFIIKERIHVYKLKNTHHINITERYHGRNGGSHAHSCREVEMWKEKREE